MVIHHGHDLAGAQVVRSLGQVTVVDQGDLLAGGVGQGLGGGETELLEDHLGLGIQLARHGGNVILALGLHQGGVGNGGGDRIGIRTFVTNDIHRHSVIPPRT